MDMTKLTVAFRNFANALKNYKCNLARYYTHFFLVTGEYTRNPSGGMIALNVAYFSFFVLTTADETVYRILSSTLNIRLS
jgi:hypothetical protein